MDKDEFMRKALDAFEENVKNLRGCFKKQLNLAWEEGAKQGEYDKTITTPDIPLQELHSTWTDYIPEACKKCSNHPSNGGSGICHCTLVGAVMKW